MALNPNAGKPARLEDLTNIPRLMASYYANKPDMSKAEQRVAFGTSGHRGSSLNSAFTESHILAISQAIVEFRNKEGVTGPIFVGMDTHALSEAALITAVEVLALFHVHVERDAVERREQRYRKDFRRRVGGTEPQEVRVTA